MTTVTGNEDLIYMAKIAEQAERYDEMVNFMKQFAQAENKLSVEQRNLLSVAYKNVIGARRASWRIISSIEQKEESKGHADQVVKIKEYRKKIEEELYVVCNDILDLLSESLLSKVEADEERVFYYKMQGDYYRYIAEYASGDKRKEAADSAREAYENASRTAQQLDTTNPIRLGLALNYSVFYYEILNSPETACTLARDAFDSAIAHLEHVEEESYRDSTLILQLLRDNLTLWTSDLQGEADKPDMDGKSDNEEI